MCIKVRFRCPVLAPMLALNLIFRYVIVLKGPDFLEMSLLVRDTSHVLM